MTRASMRGLAHFWAVRTGAIPPRFVRARTFEVPDRADADRRAQHRAAVERLRAAEGEAWASVSRASRSLLDVKIQLAERAFDACDLCPHHCRVNRNRGEVGYCGVAAGTAVHWEGILHGEELPLVPSHEVFLSGCTMRCAFCYSHEHITRPMSGQVISPAELAACAGRRAREGATNLNLVGGEPTVHLPTILRALRHLDAAVPVVWNSNMYATAEAMELLDGVVDLFLGDIHFGNDACARKLGRVPRYLDALTGSFRAAVDSGASVIIRHLVMPGHLDCCARPAMEWARFHFPETPFHLMFQYLPDYRAEGDPVLGRVLSHAEIERARAMAQEVGVLLYADPSSCPRPRTRTRGSLEADRESGPEPIGDAVEIVIHDDGRVTFTRLLEELLDVADALSPEESRLVARREAV